MKSGDHRGNAGGPEPSHSVDTSSSSFTTTYTVEWLYVEPTAPFSTFETLYKTEVARDALSPEAMDTFLSASKTTSSSSSSHKTTSTTSATKSSSMVLPSYGVIEQAVSTSTRKSLTTVTTTEDGGLSTETLVETIVGTVTVLKTETSFRTETTTVHVTDSMSSRPLFSFPTMMQSVAGNTRPSDHPTPPSPSDSGTYAAPSAFGDGAPDSGNGRDYEPSGTPSTGLTSVPATTPATSATTPSSRSSSHSSSIGPPAHTILPLDNLWAQLDKDKVYAAYFIPLEIDAKKMVAAHIHDFEKFTMEFGSDKQSSSTHSGTTVSHHSSSTHHSTPAVTDIGVTHSHSTSTSSKHPTTYLASCEPKTVTKIHTRLATVSGQGVATTITSTMTIPRTHEHRTGSCVTVKSNAPSDHSSSSKSTLSVSSTKASWNSSSSLVEPAGGPTAPFSSLGAIGGSSYHGGSAPETRTVGTTRITTVQDGIKTTITDALTIPLPSTVEDADVMPTSDPFADDWTQQAAEITAMMPRQDSPAEISAYWASVSKTQVLSTTTAVAMEDGVQMTYTIAVTLPLPSTVNFDANSPRSERSSPILSETKPLNSGGEEPTLSTSSATRPFVDNPWTKVTTSTLPTVFITSTVELVASTAAAGFTGHIVPQ
ncbi:hypothetical protein LTR85_005742 [Meristemomyces frigidus]|nr:hypothetical protein LTR85_005742 [Meristemomyces frigidus]